MSVRANDRKFVYFERRKKLELRFSDLSAAKKVKIEHYKLESEKMASLEAEIEAVAVRNGKMEEMIAALRAKEEEIENQEVSDCPFFQIPKMLIVQISNSQIAQFLNSSNCRVPLLSLCR